MDKALLCSHAALREGLRFLLQAAGILALVLALARGEAQDAASEETWQIRHQSDRFDLSAEPPGVPNLAEYADLCETALSSLAPDLPHIGERILVRVCRDREEFEQRTRMSGHGTMAVAFPDRGEIVLNAQALRQALKRERMQVVAHEMVHLLLGRIADGEAHVPFYLHEGLALDLSGDRELERNLRLAWANLFGRHIPMERLIHSFPYNTPQTQLAYAQSESFTRHVIRREMAFNDPEHFFSALLDDPQRAKAMLARMSDPDLVAIWHARWIESTRGVRNWVLILTSGGFLWVLVTILFISTYLYKHRKAKHVMEDWDSWERED